jgi:hypothetical protein
MLSLIFLIVITDPYQDIDYSKVNVYEIESNYTQLDITSYSPGDENPEEAPEYSYPKTENTYYIFR